jgi:host factor-I protein
MPSGNGHGLRLIQKFVGGMGQRTAREYFSTSNPFGERGGHGMMKTQINIQDQFLNRVRRDRKHVVIELTTGRKIEGVILSFDNFCVVLRGEADQLVYKHAICSISPGERIEFLETR